MKYIITETQAERLQVLRRIKELREYIKSSDAFNYICDYTTFDDFLYDGLYLGMQEDGELDWVTSDNIDYVFDVINTMFYKELKKVYKNRCD
jgi:hypothetical protein